MVPRTLIGLSLLLAGCAHTAVSVNGGSTHRTSVVGSGGGIQGGGLQVQASGAPAAAIVIGAAVIGIAHEASDPIDEGYRSFTRSFTEWLWERPAPAMDPTRTVSEQDCSKPIAGSGNLRCR